MFRLTMTFGGKTLRKFTFEKESISIGRDGTCDIVVENIGASRRHATVERTAEGYVLSDLQSHNGTFVHGEKVFHHRLANDDEFFIGKYAFRFEALDPAPAAVAVAASVAVDAAGAKSGAAHGATSGASPDAADALAAPLSVAALIKPSAGLEDRTLRLDRRDIERIMGLSARGTQSKLVQVAPEREKRVVSLDRPYCVVGSDATADVRTPGLFAPWRAAVLVRTEQGWRFLGVSPKARVNGRACADVALQDGDLVQVGRRRFRFCQG